MNFANLKDNWNDVENLRRILLEVTEEQMLLAGKIADAEVEYNSVFISEKEAGHKVTDSMARARARAAVGSRKTRSEYEFEALSNLINIITSHISQLLSGSHISLPPSNPPEATSEQSA